MKSSYNFKLRATAFIAAVIFIISLFIADLFRIQVVNADEYTSKKLKLSSASATVDALRGEILDSTGKALVYNVSSNTVYIDASYFPKASKQEERNEILLSLVRLFEENGVEYNSSLPIELEGSELVYAENSGSDKNYLFGKDYLNLNVYATAQNCFDALCEYYSLEDMSAEEALKVGGILFRMTRADFSTANPFTLAEGVPDSVVLILKEQSRFYSGIETRIDTKREYYDGTLAPHIIGYYDYIDADEYKSVTESYNEQMSDESLTDEEKETLKLRAYKMTDKIGKFGIESAMEDTLRGTRGKATTVTSSDSTKTTSITTEPVNGNNVILTINADLQKTVQNALAGKIEETKGTENVAAAGSIVVMDVHDFSVLACATYPSYDLNTYKENIVELNTDETAPLWNRALRSTYAPGSTVKPAVAMAGLEEGIVTPDSRIKCNILYTYFADRTFRCFNVGSHAGRSLNVEEAIRYSCNTYFYEVGRLLGIEKMGEYFSMFGLGSKTGVELTEASGVVAGPAEREAAGGVWYPGDTVQAAIGQSDNLFTPIQLAAYVSTLANGGTRYRAHFVKSVMSSDYSEIVYETQPEVLAELDFSESSKAAVKKGMISMANTLSAFRSLDYQVASKTGTAQVKKNINGKTVEYTNGFLISYAPADNPQIAVVVAIENVTSTGLASYAAEIYEAYFGRNESVTASQQSNSALR